jgi:hypothetical protein
VVTNIDPKLLAEYDDLTVMEVKLEAELTKVRQRRDELRSLFLGNVTEVADPTPVPVETPKKATKDRKPLSQWERLARKPPLALRSTIEAVKQFGQATNKQIAEKLKIPIGTASLRLSRAAREGWLSRVAQGVYEVEPLGGVMVTKDT